MGAVLPRVRKRVVPCPERRCPRAPQGVGRSVDHPTTSHIWCLGKWDACSETRGTASKGPARSRGLEQKVGSCRGARQLEQRRRDEGPRGRGSGPLPMASGPTSSWRCWTPTEQGPARDHPHDLLDDAQARLESVSGLAGPERDQVIADFADELDALRTASPQVPDRGADGRRCICANPAPSAALRCRARRTWGQRRRRRRFANAYPQRAPADPAVVARGKAIYSAQCAFCHGQDARGGGEGGPSLIRSEVVLKDQNGELIGQVVRTAVPACRSST